MNTDKMESVRVFNLEVWIPSDNDYLAYKNKILFKYILFLPGSIMNHLILT